MTPTVWTLDRVGAAETMWKAGVSSGVMAARLSEQFGMTITRNAVMGLVHRNPEVFPVRETVIYKSKGRSAPVKGAKKTAVPRMSAEERKARKRQRKLARALARQEAKSRSITPGLRFMPAKSLKDRVSLRGASGFLHLDGRSLTARRKYAWRGTPVQAARILAARDDLDPVAAVSV